MRYFYLAHKIKGQWLILGYDGNTWNNAYQEARHGYPEATEIKLVGMSEGYPHPLPDKAVILAETLMNVGETLR